MVQQTDRAAKRIFTAEELREFSKGYMQLALENIDSGDLERARYWCQREADTNSQIHDLLVNTVAGLMSDIYDLLGEKEAIRAIRKNMGIGVADELIALRKQGPKEWVQWCVDMWRQHATDPGLTVEEDDEKLTIRVRCGSGGRLVDQGAYEGPDGYRRLMEPGPQTWGEVGVPIYCGHCPWVHEMIPIERGGVGAQFWVHASPFPKNPGDPCVHYIYKDPRDIPEMYYRRLGLEKPVDDSID